MLSCHSAAVSTGRWRVGSASRARSAAPQEKEGFPLTALREIHLLMTLQHTNVVNVEEMVVGARMDNIFLVMEYLPRPGPHPPPLS